MTPFYQLPSQALTPGLILLPQFGSPSGSSHRPLIACGLTLGERGIL